MKDFKNLHREKLKKKKWNSPILKVLGKSKTYSGTEPGPFESSAINMYEAGAS